MIYIMNEIKLSELDKEINKGDKEMENNNKGLLFLELAFGNSFPFFEALQVNLQKRQLELQKTNLKITAQNNIILRGIYESNLKISNELNNIHSEIKSLKDIIENKEMKEEKENIAKEIIFNLKIENKNINKSNDKLFVYYASNLLLQVIQENNLTTRDFNSIEDKEYFLEIKEALENQVKLLTDNEKKEVELFCEYYMISKELENEINSDKFLNNRYMIELENINLIKPEKSEILELEESLINASLYGEINEKLQKYIKNHEEIPDFLENIFLKEKRKYEEELEKYFIALELKPKLEEETIKNKEYNDKKKLALILEQKLNDFLLQHKDFEKYFEKINLAFKEITFTRKNYTNILKENQNLKLKEFEEEENRIREKIKNNFYLLKLKNEEKIIEEKKKKQKIILSSIIVLILFAGIFFILIK